jgi:hypothetical protein
MEDTLKALFASPGIPGKLGKTHYIGGCLRGYCQVVKSYDCVGLRFNQ